MFYTNLVKYCKMIGKTIYEVAEENGIKSTSTISGWKSGSVPRKGVVNSIVTYFNNYGLDITAADLLAEDSTNEIAVREMLRDRAECRILFDAAKDAPASALLEAAALITRYKEKSSAT